MILQRSFQDAILQAEDEYQLIAICYSELLSYKDDYDVIFIARIGNLRQDVFFQAYAELFEELRENVVALACQLDMKTDCDGIGFETFQRRLLQMLEQFSCPQGLTENVCIPICIFFILEAIDMYLENNFENIYSNLQTYGPLNEGSSQETCLVYFQEWNSFLHDCYTSPKKEENFRIPHGPVRLGSIFHRFLLIRRMDQHRIPKILPILLNDKHKKAVKSSKQLQIASIPYTGFDTFLFHELNKDAASKPGRTLNGPFYVEYVEAWEESNRRYVTNLLEMAVRQGANIVIFPEFIMSTATKEAVKDCLRNIEYSSKQRLLLVLAGTCYHWDGTERGNNILHILNADGIEIGCYYKYSPFLQQAEERVHGADLLLTKKSVGKELGEGKETNQLRQYLKNCEILSDPGKECVLLDVEGVGRILPAICRDVIDGVFTEQLSKLFMPSLLMVPAWSPSVESFRPHFEQLANTIHTASFLCNCCNAVKAEENEVEKAIGKFFVPAKIGAKMGARALSVNRTPECAALCQKCGGCVFQIILDFSTNQPISKIVSQYIPPKECAVSCHV